MAKKKLKVGRKRLPDDEKTVLVGFYTKAKVVKAFGGLTNIREFSKQHAEIQAKNLTDNTIII